MNDPDAVDTIILQYLHTAGSIHLSARSISRGLERSGHRISSRSVAYHLQHLPVDATMTIRRKYCLQEQE